MFCFTPRAPFSGHLRPADAATLMPPPPVPPQAAQQPRFCRQRQADAHFAIFLRRDYFA